MSVILTLCSTACVLVHMLSTACQHPLFHPHLWSVSSLLVMCREKVDPPSHLLNMEQQQHRESAERKKIRETHATEEIKKKKYISTLQLLEKQEWKDNERRCIISLISACCGCCP